AFIVGNSELDADMDITVYEATDAEGSGAQVISGLTDDFVDGTDETRAGIIEVRDDDLSDGFSYVGLLVTPGAANTFCAFALLGEAYQNPVSNGTEDGVAWIVGE
ncbi:MAG: hypothetical protein K8I82_00255, partial [Anaerolineae bacterium]|nr:hypothetical protein [Anaerolineae bacterium]